MQGASISAHGGGENSLVLEKSVKGGGRIRETSGSYLAVSLANVRKFTLELEAEASLGIDRFKNAKIDRAMAKAKQASQKTVAEVLAIYVQQHLSGFRQGRERRMQLYGSLADTLSFPMKALTRGTLQAAVIEKLNAGKDAMASVAIMSGPMIRRWAQRSHAQPENAQVFVREQDTLTGFRYVIEKISLERKITQELAFEAKQTEEDRSGQALSAPYMPAHVPLQEIQENLDRTALDTPAPVHPGPDMSGDEPEGEEQVRKLAVSTVTDSFLKDQIGQKDRQIAELTAQIERRDRHIDAMLERDRETNFLINTLQEALSPALGLESPTRMQPRARSEGDSPASGDERDAVYSGQ